MKHSFAKISFLFMALLTSCNSKPTTSCDSTYVAQGTFSSFSEIASIFTENELINIAYINNGHEVYDAEGNEITIDQSILVDIEPLDNETELTIRKDYYNSIKDTLKKEQYIHPDDPFSDVEIADYCGYYHGYHVLRFSDIGDFPAVEGTEIIFDLTFTYPYAQGNKLIGWKKN